MKPYRNNDSTMTPEEEAEWVERAKAGTLFPAAVSTVRHGTTSMYKYGCRCSDCRQASSDRRRAYYASNPERGRAYARAYRARVRARDAS